MQIRVYGIWLTMLIVAAVFCLLYLWALVFPGDINPEITRYFSLEQIAQGRSYAGMLRLLFILGFILNTGLLLWLAFGDKGLALTRIVRNTVGGSYWGGIVLYALMLWSALTAISLPFAYLSSYYWNHRWGFSTQGLGSWWWDFAKGSVIEALLFLAGTAILFLIMQRCPKSWWAISALFFSIWLVVQIYLWPVVVSPLFNRFTPASDPKIIAMVQELAQKAEVPIEEVLIMDASSRTTKANAYFAGLGKTKRIVFYDTLLKDYPLDEIRAVAAHEIAHWKEGHILKGLGFGAAGSFFLFALLYFLLRTTVTGGIGRTPHTLVLVLLFFSLISFIGSPLENYISREMEKEADRVAVGLTGDYSAAVRLQLDLARKNLSDPAPPAFIKWYSYTHPDILSRIANIEKSLEQAKTSQ